MVEAVFHPVAWFEFRLSNGVMFHLLFYDGSPALMCLIRFICLSGGLILIIWKCIGSGSWKLGFFAGGILISFLVFSVLALVWCFQFLVCF